MTPLTRLIVEQLGISLSDVERIISSAPRRYKVYNIPKRSGGVREIAQPAREIKTLQRIVLEAYLESLPVHESAMAYVKGKSIVANASAHSGGSPILKMDFKDFFPSIQGDDWRNYCLRNPVFEDANDIDSSTNILFRKAKGDRNLKLSIGAPTSPALSNILMFQFDNAVAAEANRRGIVYTRYADDITFSGQRIGMLRDMIEVVRASRNAGNLNLTVNNEKTVFATKAGRRRVTGLILANDGTISLGRDWKRKISAQLHHAKNGKLNQGQMQHLAGNLAYANSVEPEYLQRLSTKYGAEVVDSLRRMVVLRRL